jgi:RNA polymerase sigma factor (sigma-70 family)
VTLVQRERTPLAAVPADPPAAGHFPAPADPPSAGDLRAQRDERKQRVAMSGSARGAVRTDLEEIFRRNYSGVVAVASRVLGSRDQAEDVAQDVFLSFGHSSVPAEEASGWLAVAAAHTALNLLRSGKRRATREETANAVNHSVVTDVAEAVVTREERSRVRDALAQLPRKQAIALVLRHSGLSYAEVAAALDLSPTSVGTTVRRAESLLRKELNQHASSN